MTKTNGNGRKWWLGIAITVAVMALTGYGGYAVLQQDVSRHETDIAGNTEAIHTLQRTQDRIDERLKSIDASQERMENQQLQIITLLGG